MSGLELLPKAREARPDVPVIMITAYGDAETKRKAFEGGAEALLTKPIDLGTLHRDEIETPAPACRMRPICRTGSGPIRARSRYNLPHGGMQSGGVIIHMGKSPREVLVEYGHSLGYCVEPQLGPSRFYRSRNAQSRIGFLGLTSPVTHARLLNAFRRGLHDLGYVEGQNIVLEYRWAEGRYDRLPQLATELIQANVELVVAYGSEGALAAKRSITTVPVVAVSVGDFVGAGIV